MTDKPFYIDVAIDPFRRSLQACYYLSALLDQSEELRSEAFAAPYDGIDDDDIEAILKADMQKREARKDAILSILDNMERNVWAIQTILTIKEADLDAGKGATT